MEQIKERLEQNLENILKDSKEILEKYSLSNLKVIGFQVGEKTDKVKPSQAPILKDFNEVLEKRNLQDAYIIEFTIAEDSGKEGFCQIKIDGYWITVRCGR
ncbi:hypothetical protein AB0758_33010 [Tolypothrix bouteillei VB521301_2]|uniref:Uncharacterized protein n=1 Tax=Tolypothrix bouteillei VB521301 TaxID=1479485 RepID=A0A0C1R8E8_9CYAN|nr:hypothetical protein [Tolypothrix bouteillei]KAF3884085.1 hypothetical protein DA73_0400000140 [Tolypothrix bouteillei VB521301]